MINLQNEYAKLIQQELDKNTQGLRFEVSLNNLKSDSELQRFLQIPNTYAQEIKRYIPVVIEAFDGDFAELENMSAAEIFANMTLLIPTDEFDVNNQVVEETFMLVSQALNEMSKRTRAKVFQLGDKCFILPRNNQSVIDLSGLFAVNLDFEIEFTNKENNEIIEFLDNITISKSDFGDYEINKRYKVKTVIEELNIDSFISSIVPTCPDKNSAQQQIENSEPLSDPQYNVLGRITRINYGTGGGVQGFCSSFYFQVQEIDGSNEWVLIAEELDPNEINNTNFLKIIINDEVKSFVKINQNNLGEQLKLLAQYEKIYSLFVTNHQNEIVYEVDDFSTISNEGGIPWGSEGTITLNFSLPRRLSNQMTLGEYNYQEFEINSSGSYNDRAFVGQHIQYFLNNVRIFPVSRDEGYIGEPDNARFLGSNKGNRSVIEQTSIGKEYALYYIPEPKVVDLLEQITSEEPNANKLYTLKIIYPLFVKEHTTVISQGGLSIVNSTPIGVAFSLEIADDEILN